MVLWVVDMETDGAEAEDRQSFLQPASIPSPLESLRDPLFDVFLSKQDDLNWVSRPFLRIRTDMARK